MPPPASEPFGPDHRLPPTRLAPGHLPPRGRLLAWECREPRPFSEKPGAEPLPERGGAEYADRVKKVAVPSFWCRLASLFSLRWARFLRDEKSGKESLRAFPPKNPPGVPGWNCVSLTLGPSPLLWPLGLPPHQATLGSWPYKLAVSTSGPTLEKRRCRRRELGHRQLGTAALPG